MIVSVALLPDEGKLRRIKLKGLPDRVLKAPEMEVRIKQGEEMIDATIEMVDGVMVVSPKEVKFEPKDGDVLASDKSHAIYIFKENISEDCNIGYIGINNSQELRLSEYEWGNLIFRPATEEEKQKLFDKLAEEGLAWDAERKELVKLKWKPEVAEVFHFPIFSDELGKFVTDYQENDGTIFMSIERDWCFKTEQECQEFCDRLNEAISQVKP